MSSVQQNLPAKTKSIPLTNVRFFLPDSQCPTKQIVPAIKRITRLESGNQVDRRIVTETETITIFLIN